MPIKVISDSKAATLLTLATNTGEERMLDPGEMLHLEKSYLNNKIAPSLPAGAPATRPELGSAEREKFGPEKRA